MERQITNQPYNHILTNTGVWSPDGRWIVYDVRSDAAGSAFDGSRIERVNVDAGEVEVLYESSRGAHCGVVTCSPVDERMAFILGPEDPTPDWQYAAWHRQGVIIDASKPGELKNIDACNVSPPFTPGALRGGSHVHVFSGDGRWISFTYEDHVLATRTDTDGDVNQRNIGVAAPFGPVRVPRSHPHNHDGAYFCVVVTKTANDPRPGSDDISRAYEDAWVGASGYVRPDGSRQTRALAFLGDVVAADGSRLSELFIVDVPDDVTCASEGPLEGTLTKRLAPPAGTAQRRLTFTADRRYPGVQGVRHWPRSSPDGSRIAFLMRDNDGIVQLWTVSPNGGTPRQVTRDSFDVASAFTWNHAGSQIAYAADGDVRIVDVESGQSRRLSSHAARAESPPRPEACVFSPDGRQVAYVRKVESAGGTVNQVFVAEDA